MLLFLYHDSWFLKSIKKKDENQFWGSRTFSAHAVNVYMLYIYIYTIRCLHACAWHNRQQIWIIFDHLLCGIVFTSEIKAVRFVHHPQANRNVWNVEMPIKSILAKTAKQKQQSKMIFYWKFSFLIFCLILFPYYCFCYLK